MSGRARLINAGIAAVIVIVALVVLVGRGSGDDAPEPQSTPAAATPAATTATDAEPAETATATPTETPTPEPTPEVVRVRAVNSQPVGGVKKIRATKGDTVRFTVTSDTEDAVHLHGYDVEKPVGPGKPARFEFGRRSRASSRSSSSTPASS